MHRAQTVDILDDRARATLALGTCRYSFGEGPSLALTDCKFVVEKRRGFHCSPFHCDLQRRVKRTSVQSVARGAGGKEESAFEVSHFSRALRDCELRRHNAQQRRRKATVVRHLMQSIERKTKIVYFPSRLQRGKII